MVIPPEIRLSKPMISNFESASVAEGDIVVVMFWHLGDILNATSLLPGLAVKHGRKLTFVTTRTAVPLLENNPHLDKILVFPLDIPDHVTVEHFLTVKNLVDTSFPRGVQVYNLPLPIDLRLEGDHIVQLWARAVGIDSRLENLRPFYAPTKSGTDRFTGQRYLVLGSGGSISIKHWPMSRWEELVGVLSRKFPDVLRVQLGGKSDQPIPGTEDLRGQTSIAESFHLLKRSLGCITNDSFLGHLAGAAECPAYVIFGSTAPRHFQPLGDRVQSFGSDLFCKPCLRNWCMLSMGLTTCWAFPSVRVLAEAVEKDLAGKSSPSGNRSISSSSPSTKGI